MVRSIICAKTGACTVARFSSARLGSVGYSSAVAPVERELGASAADRRDRTFARRLDPDELVGELAHDLVELLGGGGDAARLVDLRGLRCRGSPPRDPSLRARGCLPCRACAPRAARWRGSASCCASRRSTGSARALAGAPPSRSRASCCFSFVKRSWRSSGNRRSLLAPTKAAQPDAGARVVVLSSEGEPNAEPNYRRGWRRSACPPSSGSYHERLRFRIRFCAGFAGFVDTGASRRLPCRPCSGSPGGSGASSLAPSGFRPQAGFVPELHARRER